MPEETPPQPTLEDEHTAQAVDDIVAREGDELLAVEDERRAAAAPVVIAKPGLLKRFFRAWLGSPKKRWATFLLLFAAGVAIGVTPQSRYAILNAAGVRAGFSIGVIDQSTLQPLEEVTVSVQGKTARTDEGGQARLDELKLGPAELTLSKPGFATIKQRVTLGWGSNPQDDIRLEPTGAQYAFRVTDYLSGQGVAGAQALSGEAKAQADDKGVILLTLEEPREEIEIALSAPGYLTEKLDILATDTEEHPVQLVPARKHAFISNRSGTLDLYKVDIDGQNEELVLEGIGTERSDTVLLPHPSANIVALLSRRSNRRGSDGLALPVLTIVNLTDNQAKTLVTSSKIQLLGWSGRRLAYTYIDSKSAADGSERSRLATYEYRAQHTGELASANTFNAALMAAGDVYYAPAAVHQNGVNVSLFRVSPDGSSSKVILAREVRNIVRTDYGRLALAVGEEWYSYRIGSDEAPARAEAPTSLESRIFIDSADRRRSLTVEQQGGKGALIIRNNETGKSNIRYTQAGLTAPVSWLDNNALVYRLHTQQETADYALSIHGGEPKKIRDVTNTAAY